MEVIIPYDEMHFTFSSCALFSLTENECVMKEVRRSFMVTAVFTLMLCMVQGVHAQRKLNVTFRPGFNYPVNDLGSTEIKNGGGFEFNFSYGFVSRFAAYAGWGWSSFSPAASDNPVSHYEENGVRFGLQFIQPLSTTSQLNLHLNAGGVGHHIESEDAEGEIIDDSGHGLGWEVEAALSFPLNKRWQIVPGIRYHSLSRNITTAGVLESVDLNYISLGVGVSWMLAGY
jgi:hypothetical protein